MTRLAKIAALSLLAYLFGCAPAVGIQIHASQERGEWAIAEIERAAEAGLPVYPDADGPLHLVVVEDWATELAGQAIDRRHCDRVAIVKAGSPQFVVAHEVGHLLGLQHHNNRGNIMHTPTETNSDEFTEKQIRKATATATRLAGCW